MKSQIKDMIENWRSAGIEEGDMVMLHSSAKRTLKEHGITPVELLDSFLEAIGDTGTLLLPTFNFDWNDVTHKFDIRDTPSHMGVLTEVARKRGDAARTKHPVYSFAVLGDKMPFFTEVNNYSGYGKHSPFDILYNAGGKIAILDLPHIHAMTFDHYTEEMCEAPYRFDKEFSGEYTDWNGRTEQRTYMLNVRKQGVLTRTTPLQEALWNDGLYSGERQFEGHGLRVISARKLFAYVSNIIYTGRARGMMYLMEGDE